MSISWRDIAFRLTGVTVGPVGVSWVPPEDEKKTIFAFIVALGDRRVLFDKGCGSDRAAMVSSVARIREDVTSTLTRLGPESHLSPTIRQIREACHRFQTSLEQLQIDSKTGLGGQEEDLFIAIGRFRESVGERIARLAAKCELDLDDKFESVLPVQHHIGDQELP